MGRKPKLDATRMPVIHEACDLCCLKIDVSDAVGRWIRRNKRYYFRYSGNDVSMFEVPRVLHVLSSSGGESYFKVKGTRCVGPEIVKLNFEIDGCIGAYIVFEFSLRRISKKMAVWTIDFENGPHPIADVNEARAEDFAATDIQLSGLTHWLNNPTTIEVAPYTAIASQVLPNKIVELCRRYSLGVPGNPFNRHYVKNVELAEKFPKTFTFIDLFAGIGGFRLALQYEGGKCIFSSEINDQACDTYRRNFGDIPFGDITAEETKRMIPAEFDILCGGFPCQAFSLAGLKKGFNDTRKRGTLYQQVVSIAAEHHPKVIFCENVKGLLNKKLRYQDGEIDVSAIDKIHADLETAGPGYHIVFQSVLDSADFGVAQHRERLYIVAVRNDVYARSQARGVNFQECLDGVPRLPRQTIGDIREKDPVDKSYYIGQQYLETLERHREKHKGAGHGFGFEVKRDGDVASTLMCGGMGRERNLIHDENQTDWAGGNKKGGINRKHYRFMTISEWRDLQGFPKNFAMPSNPTAGYKQFGNCVTVNTVQAVGKAILTFLRRSGEEI